jgi:hypothetical protein
MRELLQLRDMLALQLRSFRLALARLPCRRRPARISLSLTLPKLGISALELKLLERAYEEEALGLLRGFGELWTAHKLTKQKPFLDDYFIPLGKGLNLSRATPVSSNSAGNLS